VIGDFLVHECGMDTSAAVGFMVHTECTYFRPLTAVKTPLVAGLAVSKLGKTSVDYKTALFEVPKEAMAAHSGPHLPVGIPDDAPGACLGEYTHVFVNPRSQEKVSLPDHIRSQLQRLLVDK